MLGSKCNSSRFLTWGYPPIAKQGFLHKLTLSAAACLCFFLFSSTASTSKEAAFYPATPIFFRPHMINPGIRLCQASSQWAQPFDDGNPRGYCAAMVSFWEFCTLLNTWFAATALGWLEAFVRQTHFLQAFGLKRSVDERYQFCRVRVQVFHVFRSSAVRAQWLSLWTVSLGAPTSRASLTVAEGTQKWPNQDIPRHPRYLSLRVINWRNQNIRSNLVWTFFFQLWPSAGFECGAKIPGHVMFFPFRSIGFCCSSATHFWAPKGCNCEPRCSPCWLRPWFLCGWVASTCSDSIRESPWNLKQMVLALLSILEKPCGARRAWNVNKLQVQKDYWLVRNSWGELLVKEFWCRWTRWA